MKDKEIEEMAQIINGSTEIDTIEYYRCRNIAITLYLQGYRKIPEGAVVLTEGEYSDILSDEIQTIKRDVAEFWAYANFDEVVKELHNLGYRKLDDHAIVSLRKAHGIENKIRKETAREILDKVVGINNLYGFGAVNTLVKKLAREYGVEVKE
jgi:hypothetical protein